MNNDTQQSNPVQYSIDWFINKFRSIHSRKWTTGLPVRTRPGQCCALGHCGVKNDYEPTDEAKALVKLFNPGAVGQNWIDYGVIFSINDSGYLSLPTEVSLIRLKSPKPRGRILEALKLLKKRSTSNG